MQRLHLGAIIVVHDHGEPVEIRQVGGRPAHEIVSAVLLASEEIAEACEAHDREHPEELDFDG